VIRELQDFKVELDIAVPAASRAPIRAAGPWPVVTALVAAGSLSRPRKFLDHWWDKAPQYAAQCHRGTTPGGSRAGPVQVAKQGLKLQWIQSIAGQP
jgi:hypothetical protein